MVFDLILGTSDGFYPQGLAFKHMLDSYKIQNIVHIHKDKDHSLFFFKFPADYKI